MMKRIQVIDLVRTLSISLVIGMHLFDTKGLPSGRVSFSLHDLSVNFSNGSYGVSLFFVVSGYLITGLALDGRVKNRTINFMDFYVKRAGRILPLFFLILAVGWVTQEFVEPNTWINGYMFQRPRFPYDNWFWLSFPTLSFNWLLALRLNLQGLYPGVYWSVLWSLSIEEQFYLSYPWILGKMGRVQKIPLFLSLVVAGGILYRIVLSCLGFQNYYYTVITSFGSFDQIAMGGLLFWVSESQKGILSKNKSQCSVLCVLGAAIMAVTYAGMSIVYPTYLNFANILGPTFISMGCFLFLLGGIPLEFFKSKLWRWLSFPGQLSYGCYLWHSMVIFLLWPLLRDMPPLPSLLLTLVAVTFFAYLSYLFIERPVNKAIRRFFRVEKAMPLSVSGLKPHE